MDSQQSEDLLLESLSTGIPTLTKTKADMLKEACIWCLTSCEHNNGVPIECIMGDDRNCFSIKWGNDVDLEGILKAYNLDDAVEFGAEAISLLIIREKTEFTTIERAVRGTGIDYWLGYKDENRNGLFSMRDARLEISGLLKESGSNTVKNRINTKLKQIKASNHTFPVFISIIEFSNPKAETVRKDEIN